jgi:predicted flap endonuclease-1-like 5' DNA nuclease
VRLPLTPTIKLKDETMLWLTWHMWILLLLAFGGGVITGWVLRSRSDEPERPRLSAGEPAKASTPSPAPKPAPAPAASPAPAAGEASGATTKAPTPAASKAKSAAPDAPAAAAKSSAVADGPKPVPGAAVNAPEPGAGDDLTQIKGVGPKAAEKLNEAGVTKVGQIAKWTGADVERFDALINGRGRIERDDWVGQAKKLAS